MIYHEIVGWEKLKEPCFVQPGDVFFAPAYKPEHFDPETLALYGAARFEIFLTFRNNLYRWRPGKPVESTEVIRKLIEDKRKQEEKIGIKRKYRTRFSIYRPITKSRFTFSKYFSKPLPLP